MPLLLEAARGTFRRPMPVPVATGTAEASVVREKSAGWRCRVRRVLLRRKKGIALFSRIAQSSQHGVNSNIFSIFSVRYAPSMVHRLRPAKPAVGVARHSRAHSCIAGLANPVPYPARAENEELPRSQR